MAYDGCSVQMMDHLIDLTGQVNKRVEELQRRREQSDRSHKLPSSSMRRRRCSRYPRDPNTNTRQGSWAAMPDMMMLLLQDPTANGAGQQGPASLSHFEKATCTSSPVFDSDTTLCDPTTKATITTTGAEAAGVLDGDPGKFSGSASVPGSTLSGTGASAGPHAMTGVRNMKTRTSNRSRPRTASSLQMPPGPLSSSSLALSAAGPDDPSSNPSSTFISCSSFPSSPPPLPPSAQHTSPLTTPTPPHPPSLSGSSSKSQQQTSHTGSSSSTILASPTATTIRKPLPILADHRKTLADIVSGTSIDTRRNSVTYSDCSNRFESLESSKKNLPYPSPASFFSPLQSSVPKAPFSSRSPVASSTPLASTSCDPPSTSSSATSNSSVTLTPKPTYLLSQKRKPTLGLSTSARFLFLQAKTSGPVGTDHTFSRTSTDSMPSATLPPSSEAPNNSFLRASFDGTTARNCRSSHSNLSSQSHRVNRRWHPTSARSARSAQSSDFLQRRSPSPMFNPFTRGPRQRHPDGVSDAAARSRSNSGGVSPSSKRTRSSNGRTRRSNYNTGRRVSMAGSNPPPPLTREEFEALPVAIQRKV